MIISHRGNGNHNFKENSKEAIIFSLNDKNVDGIEIDIRFTKDKKMILCHNATYDGKIIKYTNFNDLPFEDIYTIFKNIKTKKLILLEIKDNDIENITYILNFIKTFSHLNIYVQSFYKEILLKIKKKNKNLKIGLICFHILENIHNYDFISIWFQNYIHIDKEIFVWTVNSKKQIKRFISLDINIITDKSYII